MSAPYVPLSCQAPGVLACPCGTCQRCWAGTPSTARGCHSTAWPPAPALRIPLLRTSVLPAGHSTGSVPAASRSLWASRLPPLWWPPSASRATSSKLWTTSSNYDGNSRPSSKPSLTPGLWRRLPITPLSLLPPCLRSWLLSCRPWCGIPAWPLTCHPPRRTRCALARACWVVVLMHPVPSAVPPSSRRPSPSQWGHRGPSLRQRAMLLTLRPASAASGPHPGTIVTRRCCGAWLWMASSAPPLLIAFLATPPSASAAPRTPHPLRAAERITLQPAPLHSLYCTPSVSPWPQPPSTRPTSGYLPHRPPPPRSPRASGMRWRWLLSML